MHSTHIRQYSFYFFFVQFKKETKTFSSPLVDFLCDSNISSSNSCSLR